jgi:tetratricopeptide (TPR) repeat protein
MKTPIASALAALLLILAAVPAHADVPSCLPAIAAAEKHQGIPDGLLVAIALAESGRPDPTTGLIAPWPWTINANGTGRFYDTPAEAIADVGALLGRNNAFVDVGCMQVDLYHHPQAFRTLSAAFTPEHNVDYAARFLVSLRQRLGSWPTAVAAYHSGDPTEGDAYLARVLYYWRALGVSADKAVAPPRSASPGSRTARRSGFVIDVAPGPMDVAAQFQRGGDFPAALAIYRTTLESRPDDPTALLGTADCLRQTGDIGGARLYYERALGADAENRAAVRGLVRAIETEPPEQRVGHYLSARRTAPQAPELAVGLAQAEAALGHLGEACEQMAAAVALSPSDAILALNQALLLDRAGDPAAEAAYERFLRLYRPDSGQALSVPLQAIRDRLAFLQRR